jgi:hypothetical protein
LLLDLAVLFDKQALDIWLAFQLLAELRAEGDELAVLCLKLAAELFLLELSLVHFRLQLSYLAVEGELLTLKEGLALLLLCGGGFDPTDFVVAIGDLLGERVLSGLLLCEHGMDASKLLLASVQCVRLLAQRLG